MATKPWKKHHQQAKTERKEKAAEEKRRSLAEAEQAKVAAKDAIAAERSSLETTISVSESDAYELRQAAERHGIPLRALLDLTAAIAHSWCLPSVSKQMGKWKEAEVQQQSVKGFGAGPVELPISKASLWPLQEVADAINVSVETPIMEAYHRLFSWIRNCPKAKGTSMCETYTAICTTQREWMGRAI